VIGASKVTASDAPCDEFYAANPPLVTTYMRNRPPFTIVHSHAAAPKSSDAFFHDMDEKEFRFWPGRARNALRASQGVRARDVMVNKFCANKII